jgi:hypothetical protein
MFPLKTVWPVVESLTLCASLNVFEHWFTQNEPFFEVLYLSEEFFAVYSQLWFRGTVVLQEDRTCAEITERNSERQAC